MNVSRVRINRADKAKMLHAQGGKCAICGMLQSFALRSFHIDHDHKTGKIRGILCFRCNSRLLPMLENYPDLIPKALKYLNK